MRPELKLAAHPNLNEQHSSVARTSDGRFVFAYDSTRRNSTESDVWLARFTAFGNLQAIEAVSVATNSDDERPAVSVDRNGNAVVVWGHINNPTNRDIHARAMNAVGSLSSRLRISESVFDENLPTVAVHPTNGTAVIAFVSNNIRVRVAELSANGIVDRTTELAFDSFAPSVGMSDDGRYVVSVDRLVSASRDIIVRRGQFGAGGTIQR